MLEVKLEISQIFQLYRLDFIFISCIIGVILFINSDSKPKTIAYGSVLSKNVGSSFRNNLNLFSSQALINSLYHNICEINFAHFSVSCSSLTVIKIDNPANEIKIIVNIGTANIGSPRQNIKKSLHHIFIGGFELFLENHHISNQ